MKLAPTFQGGIRIDADCAEDWLMLDAICGDAAGVPGKPLYDRLAEKMPTDPDWEEFVAPDIRDQFSYQIVHVSRSISSAQRGEDQVGVVLVEKEDCMTWYGALNQARMTLELVYQVSELDEYADLDDLAEISEEMRMALVRSHFYSAFQSLLLDYVIT